MKEVVLNHPLITHLQFPLLAPFLENVLADLGLAIIGTDRETIAAVGRDGPHRNHRNTECDGIGIRGQGIGRDGDVDTRLGWYVIKRLSHLERFPIRANAVEQAEGL